MIKLKIILKIIEIVEKVVIVANVVNKIKK